MKQSWRFQQRGTSGQTHWKVLAALQETRRARRELGWLPDSSKTPALPSVLLQFQRPYSCSVAGFFGRDGYNRAALNGFRKLQGMHMDVSPEEATSCAWEDHEAFSFLTTRRALQNFHPAIANTCLGQLWGSKYPWASFVLLDVLKGRCHSLSALDSHCGSIITGTYNGTTEVDKNFIRIRAIPSSFPSQSKATGCAHFSTVWQKD